jgi:putative oxidoreductase
MTLTHPELLQWCARAALVVLFPFSALDKIMHWQDALKQAKSSFLPGGGALLVMAILVEFFMPVMILIAWHDRAAALLLAAFCVVTAFLYHPFWRFPAFWSTDGEGRAHFWDFLKNFGLAGGLLLIALGTSLF